VSCKHVVVVKGEHARGIRGLNQAAIVGGGRGMKMEFCTPFVGMLCNQCSKVSASCTFIAQVQIFLPLRAMIIPKNILHINRVNLRHCWQKTPQQSHPTNVFQKSKCCMSKNRHPEECLTHKSDRISRMAATCSPVSNFSLDNSVHTADDHDLLSLPLATISSLLSRSGGAELVALLPSQVHTGTRSSPCD
jgi:hypothetical protein